MRIGLLCLASVHTVACKQARSEKPSAASELDYEKLIHLDAEELAEGGIDAAYEILRPKLAQYVPTPAEVEESANDDQPAYSVRCGGKEFRIYGPGLGDSESDAWGRATFAFFTLVNDQLHGSNVRLYAIGAGNDLSGMFLTAAEAHAAQSQLPNESDWPYLPTNAPPWFGMPHD